MRSKNKVYIHWSDPPKGMGIPSPRSNLHCVLTDVTKWGLNSFIVIRFSEWNAETTNPKCQKHISKS